MTDITSWWEANGRPSALNVLITFADGDTFMQRVSITSFGVLAFIWAVIVPVAVCLVIGS